MWGRRADSVRDRTGTEGGVKPISPVLGAGLSQAVDF